MNSSPPPPPPLHPQTFPSPSKSNHAIALVSHLIVQAPHQSRALDVVDPKEAHLGHSQRHLSQCRRRGVYLASFYSSRQSGPSLFDR